MSNSTLYIGPDGKLERGPSPKAGRKQKGSKARQLTDRIDGYGEAEQRIKPAGEAERTSDTWEFMHDAILSGLSGGAQQLSDRIFCPQCRSQCDAEADLIEVDGHLWGDCWQCGFRGPLSKFNLY